MARIEPITKMIKSLVRDGISPKITLPNGILIEANLTDSQIVNLTNEKERAENIHDIAEALKRRSNRS